MPVIRDSIVIDVPRGSSTITPDAPGVIKAGSYSSDAVLPAATWWCPADVLPGLMDYRRIVTPDPSSYSLTGSLETNPSSNPWLVRERTTNAGLNVLYGERQIPASGVQLHVYRATGELYVSHEEVVLGGEPRRIGPVDGRRGPGQPLTAWYCLVDEVSNLFKYGLIQPTFADGHTWIDFGGMFPRSTDSTKPMRIDVFTAYSGSGLEGVVADSIPLSRGDKSFPVSLPPIPPGKRLVNTWWCPLEFYAGNLNHYFSIWTEVIDGVVWIHQKANPNNDAGTSQIRIGVYACWA